VWSLEINASAYQGLYNLFIYVGDGKHKGNCIEWHDWVASISALCLGALRFKFWLRDWVSWLRYFVVFLSPSKQTQKQYL
jgi:hypothetical protein